MQSHYFKSSAFLLSLLIDTFVWTFPFSLWNSGNSLAFLISGYSWDAPARFLAEFLSFLLDESSWWSVLPVLSASRALSWSIVFSDAAPFIVGTSVEFSVAPVVISWKLKIRPIDYGSVGFVGSLFLLILLNLFVKTDHKSLNECLNLFNIESKFIDAK